MSFTKIALCPLCAHPISKSTSINDIDVFHCDRCDSNFRVLTRYVFYRPDITPIQIADRAKNIDTNLDLKLEYFPTTPLICQKCTSYMRYLPKTKKYICTCGHSFNRG